MEKRLLITAFGPFGPHVMNPSSRIAELLRFPSRIFEVSYQATREALEELDPKSFDILLMLGVHGATDYFRMEMFARNRIGASPDVRGEAPTGPIARRGTPVLGSTLFTGDLPDGPFNTSFDAGDYLCNFAYYTALRRFPGRQVGFLHVPTESVLPVERQLDFIGPYADELSSRT